MQEFPAISDVFFNSIIVKIERQKTMRVTNYTYKIVLLLNKFTNALKIN